MIRVFTCKFCPKQMKLRYPDNYECSCIYNYRATFYYQSKLLIQESFKIDEYMIINGFPGYCTENYMVFYRFDKTREQTYSGKGSFPYVKSVEEVVNFLIIA